MSEPRNPDPVALAYIREMNRRAFVQMLAARREKTAREAPGRAAFGLPDPPRLTA